MVLLGRVRLEALLVALPIHYMLICALHVLCRLLLLYASLQQYVVQRRCYFERILTFLFQC